MKYKMKYKIKECQDCKHYEKKTDFVGECFKIRSQVLIQNHIPESEDFTSGNKLIKTK